MSAVTEPIVLSTPRHAGELIALTVELFLRHAGLLLALTLPYFSHRATRP